MHPRHTLLAPLAMAALLGGALPGPSEAGVRRLAPAPEQQLFHAPPPGGPGHTAGDLGFDSGAGGGRDVAGPAVFDDGSAAAAVDLDAMEAEIQADLLGNSVGFAYVISKDGAPARADGFGKARRGGDGDMAMTEHVPINVASVSKIVTTVATLQLLEANGLDVDSEIAPWLPPEWALGPGVEDLTFAHLLTHATGWNQMFVAMTEEQREPWGNDWDGIQWVVAQGASPGSDYSYKNANLAVLRMIVPALWEAAGTAPFEIDPLTGFNYGWYFVGYLQDAIFDPAGVAYAGCWDFLDTEVAYAYDASDASVGGVRSGNNIYHCGGHGNLFLSAVELAAFMAHVRYDESVLSAASRALMDGLRLGWDELSNTPSNGRQGKYWHGGLLYMGGDREYQACIMKYPQNVEATLVVNSDTTTGKYSCSILKDAFNNALP